jgi:PncC family amidohydrolase
LVGIPTGKTGGCDLVNLELQSVLEKIAGILVKRGQNVSLAESCTGGLVSAYITSMPGSSKYFEGGIISYSNLVKQNELLVPFSLIESMGAVSVPVAKHMAYGVQQKLQTHWGLSVTGIAGPDGGTADKPVGTVCFAWVGPGFERVTRMNFNKSLSRSEIQQESVAYCLSHFLKILEEQ